MLDGIPMARVGARRRTATVSQQSRDANTQGNGAKCDGSLFWNGLLSTIP